MKNNNIDIFYFTGTGNTYLAAKKIADTMIEKGCNVKLIDMAENEIPSIDFTKTIGFAFPVACWNTFPFVRRFIYNLPQAFGTEAFVFTTMGDSSLKTAANFASILEDKGYKIIATKGFLMPNNLIAIQKEENNLRKIEQSYLKMESFANDIVKGISKPEKTNFFFKFCFAITSFITNLWENPISQKIIKFKTAKDKCTKCMLCVKICPVKNIEMKEYPVFGITKCQICMRCISYCPENAIKSFLSPKNKVYRALSSNEMNECFHLNEEK